jgi:hypothetical protein
MKRRIAVTTENIHFRWVPGPSTTMSELETLAAELRQADGSDMEIEFGHGFATDIPTLVAGVAIIGHLAVVLCKCAKTIKHGGLIVDGTTTPVTIREDHSLDRGQIFVIEKNGKTKLISAGLGNLDVAGIINQLKSLSSISSGKP